MNKMPVLFIGHGSPMNAIKDNKFTKQWRQMAQKIPKPDSILVISAHWYTKGTKISKEKHPKMVYDMYGFPDELYNVKYSALGAPNLANEVIQLIGEDTVKVDNTWGFDHGNWSVLNQMYPNHDIPVTELSINGLLSTNEHYKIGEKLKSLRDNNVLILGSGNVVHNLRAIDWYNEYGGFSWADEFDNFVKENIQNKNYDKVVNYEKNINSSSLAVPTNDHFLPLIYVLATLDNEDKVSVYNDSRIYGSLSMTSYLFM